MNKTHSIVKEGRIFIFKSISIINFLILYHNFTLIECFEKILYYKIAVSILFYLYFIYYDIFLSIYLLYFFLIHVTYKMINLIRIYFFYFLFHPLHLINHLQVIKLYQIWYDFLNPKHDDFCIYWNIKILFIIQIFWLKE